MTLTFKNEKSEKEEAPLVLLSAITANRFEDVKAAPVWLRPRSVRPRVN
jgi:hypothetical protein